MSYLTQPFEELQREVIAALEGEGFDFNPLTTEFPVYLATCLGDATAYKTKSVPQMLEELNTSFGGSLSHLTSSVAYLVDELATNIGESGPYVAQAVNFNDTRLDIASLAAGADSSLFSFSVWINVHTPFYTLADQILWACDTAGDFASAFILAADPPDISYYWAFGNIEKSSTVNITAGWHHILLSVDTAHPIGEKLLKMYIDDVDTSIAISDSGGATVQTFTGLPFEIGREIGGTEPLKNTDMADLWIAPGVSFLVAGDIPVETRRKFIDANGKPVFLGSSGAAPTGAAPAMFFSGDAAGFPTNRGTGGAFTLTGSLTDSGTSPSN